MFRRFHGGNAVADVVLCKSTDVENGGVAWRFRIKQGRRKRTAFVVRHEGIARAYINECAHTPMELDMDDGRFFDTSGKHLVCSTHGAMYDPTDGSCLGGPCGGAGLISLALTENDGYIYLDESHTELVEE